MRENIFLPDVNLLFAAHVAVHEHHATALSWLRNVEHFATCATTEQGLVRLLSNPISNPGGSVQDALVALSNVRRSVRHTFWPDDSSLDDPDIDTSRLSGYRQITDFHLVNLAAQHNGILATLDTHIAPALAAKDRRFVHTVRP